MGPPRKATKGHWPGHGRSLPRQRFAIPVRGLVRGAPLQAKTAPWFLKAKGSRPDYKRRQVQAAA